MCRATDRRACDTCWSYGLSSVVRAPRVILRAHRSPLPIAWEPVNFLGQFTFDPGTARPPENRRPLRIGVSMTTSLLLKHLTASLRSAPWTLFAFVSTSCQQKKAADTAQLERAIEPPAGSIQWIQRPAEMTAL